MLKNTGAYKTKQRDIVLSCIMKNKDEHFTVDEIVELLKKVETPVGKSTVYRYLNILASEGMVRKYISDDGTPTCYQYSDEGCSCTYHLRCNSCGLLLHAHDDTTKTISDTLSKLYSFTLDNSKTIFYGFCKKCGGN